MVDNGDLGTITPGIEPIVIPEGYTSGGTVSGDEKLTPNNIKTGVTIFDVEGTAILAEGNATSADVRAGVTFSSTSGSGVGSMPDNGSLGTIVPGTSNQSIPAGYTSGGTVSGDPDLVASNIKSGVEIFGVTGNVVQATGTATADKLLLGQTASTASGPITGTMPNNGPLGTITPTTTNQAIPAGYTSGGTVAGSGNLVSGNIRLGVNLFGVTGSLDPGTQTGGTAEPDQVLAGETFTNDLGVQTGTMPNNGSVTITPSGSAQTIPEGYHDGTGTVSAVIFDAAKVLEGTTIAGTAGTMDDNGALGTITPGTTNQTIPAGYTSGGTILGDIDLLSENIKNGITIFGVEGTLASTTINGQIEKTLTFSESISAYDPITVEAQFTKLPDPATMPTNSVYGVVFSSDDTYMAVTSTASPYVLIYKNVSGEYVKLSDPATLPTGAARGRAAFSPDDVYLAVAHDVSPYVTIYKRSGDTFTKLANPSVLPTGQGYEASFSSDGTYLAIVHATTPFVTIYKRSGDTFTKLSNPSTLPVGTAVTVDFSSDTTYLAVGHINSPYLTIYKRDGDTFTKLANPSTLTTGQANRVDFSSDTTYLAVAHSGGPFITVYKRSDDTFNKLDNPPLLPNNTGQGVAFSSDGNYLIVASSSNPYIVVYRRGGDVFYKLPSPVDTATINTYTAAFNSDDTILAVGSGTPYLTLFEYSEVVKKSSLPMDWINSIGVGYAKESGSTDEVKTVVLTHH
ncbi:hypothetical protein D3C74_277120 [compost metagenome]